MPNFLFKKVLIGVFIASALAGCGQDISVVESSTDGEESLVTTVTNKSTQEEIITQKVDTKFEALKNPDWISVSNLPNDWSGLYQKDCKIGGPENSHFFEYRNGDSNTVYHFAYIVFPSSLNKKPDAKVIPITYKVWQNEKWPEHYLLFGQDTYSQILLKDGWAKGMHQTIDGQPWDISQHWETKYRETDVVRWAVNLDNHEDYGSRPPCDQKLAKPWAGQVFKTKAGKSLTLQKIMVDF